MSGFSADWLRLREPADHAARHQGLLAAVGRHFAGRETMHVLDLGCGTGSNLRGTFRALPRRQRWTLVDHDACLIEAAQRELVAWADRSWQAGNVFGLAKDDWRIEACFEQADLSRGSEAFLIPKPDLVTAAALFDLVSPDWLEGFAHSLAANRLPLYTVLTFDGGQEWAPPHKDDAAVHQAFLAHQRHDKGFGPASGPDASTRLVSALSAHGFKVETAGSPWLLGSQSAGLAAELAAGIAVAVAQTRQFPPADLAVWRAFRTQAVHAPAAHCRVGHLDLWALPGA